MGLGPLNAIAQAHVSRYLDARGIADTSNSRVWCFVGDGEFDEPETIGALGMAGREHLDNLVFVVNCNLQRLDGPVRGNGKVIQEFEALFRGAGWNVIKVIWGRTWDDLLAKDVEGVLLNKMNSTVDGEFQKYATESGAYITRALLRARSPPAGAGRPPLRRGPPVTAPGRPRLPEALRRLQGGHRAHRCSDGHPGQDHQGLDPRPGDRGPQRHPPDQEDDQGPAPDPTDRLFLHEEIPEHALDEDLPPYYRPSPDEKAAVYLAERRRSLGGPLPSRIVRSVPLPPPEPAAFADLLAGSGRQAVSTTMAFARLLRSLVRDPSLGARIVPIVSDEARTFGLESLISEVQIYAPEGQRYTPVDAGLALHYAESASGQVLEEGITEAGAVAAFTAAATSYATWGQPTIPFYLFYSMFGFQRVGDLLWALGDARGRGFLLGCTAGRTTLNGEGLQHQDGHSLLLASTVPNVAAYDPAFSYEVATIVEDGIRRMTGPEPEDRVWYLTLYNENYPMPSLPDGPGEADRVRLGTIKGMYRFHPSTGAGADADADGGPADPDRSNVTLLFSGSAHLAAVEAGQMLDTDWGVGADLWSVTSYKSLREDAISTDRWNRLHPDQRQRAPYVTESLAESRGPIVAVTDFMRTVPDQVARWMPRRFTSLGTDGFGRSDTREVLRRYFEVDAAHIVVAALSSLVAEGALAAETVAEAITRYGIDAGAPDPWSS